MPIADPTLISESLKSPADLALRARLVSGAVQYTIETTTGQNPVSISREDALVIALMNAQRFAIS